MNLILFEPSECEASLPRSDPRAIHLVDVLRCKPGDVVDVGRVNGPRGTAAIKTITANAIELDYTWGHPPAPPDPLSLIVGSCRPQTARDILRDATTLGVAALHFVRTEKSEPGYGQSTLWSSGEWRRHLLTGAAQAFVTRIPTVAHGRSLDETVAALETGSTRVALDNYEANVRLNDWPLAGSSSVVLAIGAERGWSAAERDSLRRQCFGFVHLGPRILRTETAVVASLAIVRGQLGW